MANFSGRGPNRSGRFTSEMATVAKDIPIIRSGARTVRIYNSGESDFDVKLVSMGVTTTIPLHTKSSIDIRLTGQHVKIGQRANTAVEGLYEYLEPQQLIRSGRFKAAANASVLITKGASNRMYRILNSSEKTAGGANDVVLSVSIDGGNPIEVKPRQSIDVFASTDRVAVTATADFQGIYEALDRRVDTRSGRFRVRENPDLGQTIISLIGAADPAFYRVFNSGKNSFKVFAHDPMTMMDTELVKVDKDQSVDLRIDVSEIFVKSENANHPIQGIYDFIR